MSDPAPPRIRVPKVVAAGWLFGAIGLTLLVWPILGWRGHLWLGVFDGLSALAGGWELWVRMAPSKW